MAPTFAGAVSDISYEYNCLVNIYGRAEPGASVLKFCNVPVGTPYEELYNCCHIIFFAVSSNVFQLDIIDIK